MTWKTWKCLTLWCFFY